MDAVLAKKFELEPVVVVLCSTECDRAGVGVCYVIKCALSQFDANQTHRHTHIRNEITLKSNSWRFARSASGILCAKTKSEKLRVEKEHESAERRIEIAQGMLNHLRETTLDHSDSHSQKQTHDKNLHRKIIMRSRN